MGGDIVEKKKLEPGTFLFPVPSVMVSCVDKKGNENIITIAWTGTVNSKPPMVGISIRPDRYSYNLIKESQEFVVNIPNEDLTWETDYCGSVSGKKVDKFAETGMTSTRGKVVSVPMIAEAPINLECVLFDVIELGSHHLFIGEVKQVHIAEYALDERDKLDPHQAKIVTFGGKGYYRTGEKLFDRGGSIK